MPWTVDDPPPPAINWTAEERQRCVQAANAVLEEGGTEEEAIFACIHAAGKQEGKQMNHKTFDLKQLDDGWMVATTPAVDRDRDRVMPLGAQLDNYEKNPALMFGHIYHEPWALIGRAAGMGLDMDGIRFKPELRQPANESDPMHIIRALWDQKLLKAASIGFNPLEWKDNEHGGRDYTRWELLEISLVPIPANQEALRMAIKAIQEKPTNLESPIIKRGRVLSARNEQRIRQALEALQIVLSELGEGGADDDEKENSSIEEKSTPQAPVPADISQRQTAEDGGNPSPAADELTEEQLADLLYTTMLAISEIGV